jgi:EmrB/QacA subfamily drug resistance transporter
MASSPDAAAAAAPDASDKLDPHVWRVAIAVILGAFMSILDMTIVNVGLEQIGRDLHATGFDQIQWIMTGYMLAVAAVIPVTGWASDRLGGKRLFLVSLVLFTVSSALCAAAWNMESLVLFRVLQGVAGGALMPAGQILLVRAAGPHRMGRVMSVIGVPILMAPVFGPVIGGVILKYLPWEWIFLVNVPIGILGFFIALRLLPTDDGHSRADRELDWGGLALMSVGLPLVVYGLANIAGYGIDAARSWLPIVAGIALTAWFVAHALHRREEPLLDVRLFRRPAYSYAAITSFSLGAFLFGSIILLPLYYQVVRTEDVLTTGLLLAPQGLGAGLGMALSGRIVDRIGGGIVTMVGIAILTIGTFPFTQLDGGTSYWYVSIAMFVRGIGFGCTMMPSMAAAYATLKPQEVQHATPQLNVIQRVGGAVGAALLTTILQARLDDATHGHGAQVGGEGSARVGDLPASVADALGHAFGDTFWWVLGGSVLVLVPSFLLARVERRARLERAAAGGQDPSAREVERAEAVAAATTGEAVE